MSNSQTVKVKVFESVCGNKMTQIYNSLRFSQSKSATAADIFSREQQQVISCCCCKFETWTLDLWLNPILVSIFWRDRFVTNLPLVFVLLHREKIWPKCRSNCPQKWMICHRPKKWTNWSKCGWKNRLKCWSNQSKIKSICPRA